MADVNALNVACDQRPRPGETLKLDFDLFAPVSTPTLSASTAPTASTPGTLTVTASPVSQAPSSPPADIAASSSRAAVSASAAASTKNTHDKNVRVGVGVGVGVGGVAIILAVVAITFFRRRPARKEEKFEVEARAPGQAENLAAHGGQYYDPPQQEHKDRVAELSAPEFVAEADEGRPRDIELPSSEVTSRSTSRTLPNSGYGMSRFLGKPAAPT